MSAPPFAALRDAVGGRPVLVVLAGPNGAGKSTFFEHYLERVDLPYVNADRIARLLRDTDPQAAPSEIDRRAFTQAEDLRHALVAAGISFCTETVFSDPVGAKLGLMGEARRRGLSVVLVFIGLDGPQLSIARVTQRVSEGGHDVPNDKLVARFPRTLANLRAAIALVDEAFVFDNSSVAAPFRPVAVYVEGHLVGRFPPVPIWARSLPGLGDRKPGTT